MRIAGQKLNFLIPTVRKGLALLSIEALLATTLTGGITAQQRQKTHDNRLTEEQRILHVLNRLGFGARPGDIERVKAMGLENYINQQLSPESISDSLADARTKNLSTLSMTTAQLYEKYPQPGQLLRQLQRRGDLPNELAAARQNKGKIDESQKPVQQNSGEAMMPDASERKDAAPNANPEIGPGKNNEEYRRAIRDYYVQNGLQLPQRITAELQASRILRAVYSERQLQEVLVDFWTNHFNVFAGKGADRWLLVSYDRDTIRPHTLGKFHDLLLATAQSPAMLFYLDNFQSVSPNAQLGRRQPAQRDFLLGGEMRRLDRDIMMSRNPNMKQEGRPRFPQPTPNTPRQKRGINENYARELMELHTLGVDGGYTQKDVQEVARCFTGWTIRKPNEVGLFFFNPRTHDNAEKIVLGHKIPAGGGISDGDKVLDILARHPSTANFIATKLARRFVGDDPPRSVINRAAATFLKTSGSIRETLRTIITSPEFFSADAYQAKMRTPFEYVAAAMRAVGAETDADSSVFGWIARMGQPIFGRISPDGYPDRAAQWLASGAMLERLNFAVALSSNKLKGTHVDPARILSQTDLNSPTATADHLSQLILIGGVSDETRRAIDKIAREASAIPATANTLPATRATQPINYANTAVIDNPKTPVAPLFVAGLISIVLGSPEFQRR